MKKIYFVILAFVVINLGTAQSWQRLNPIPKGNSLFDIEFDANNNALPVPGNKATTDTATTFVLSNEEGKLIDRLLAAGYGNMDLYMTLVALQGSSGGVISNTFLDVLAACPAGSPIFTQELNNYAGISDGIAINTDGTVFTTSIKGRSYYGQPGYSTYPSNYVGVEMFTYANSPEYYIPAGSDSSGGTYYAFAIAWNADNTSVNDLTKNDNIIIYPNPTTGILWFIPQNNEIINRVEAYDMKGKQVFCADNVKENHIDLSGLENGIYLLELETHNQKLTQKVIKI